MLVLLWVKMAEGMNTVECGGNSTAIFKSQRTRCPPFVQSKAPRLVTAHQPQLRFMTSLCGPVQAVGPMLNVSAAKGWSSYGY